MAIAAADGFHGLGPSRRDAAWAIKGLRDEAMIVLTPVFNAMSARSAPLDHTAAADYHA
jgi:hypothetical protein